MYDISASCSNQQARARHRGVASQSRSITDGISTHRPASCQSVPVQENGPYVLDPPKHTLFLSCTIRNPDFCTMRSPDADSLGAPPTPRTTMATSALQERRKRLVNRVGRHLPCNTMQIVSDFANVATKVSVPNRNYSRRPFVPLICGRSNSPWSSNSILSSTKGDRFNATKGYLFLPP